eukprot:TRINITY_DN1255_c0_g1_i1.p1 TRINITY_DN1255_c0_g1~~TRINITY_DN1255_c0_g1_i1.p1  ORF type:complete len:206 (+),score=59.65 TRINITY_DN1255_c0_g1_i1:86-703(+)
MATQTQVEKTNRAAFWVNPLRVAVKGISALALSTVILFLDSPGQPTGLLKQDVAPHVLLPEERPKEWGHLMRRESQVVVPAGVPIAEGAAAAAATASAASAAPEHPHLMRREPKMAPVAPIERPAEWGKLMRREAKVVVPVGAAGEGAATSVVALLTSREGSRSIALIAIAVVAALGLAQQAKSALKLIRQATGMEDPKGLQKAQ